MAIFKCKMCGGDLTIENNESICECQYCGTTQTLPRLNDDRKTNLYDRANHFRRANDFDKAMGIYEQILNEDNTDSEVYWSLVLCRYGIEYVEDPLTHKRVPTVNRAQYTSIFADEDYKSAISYADEAQRTLYEKEAKAIDEIQKGILAISQKEEPFDVFICYKETDETGRRTPDSVLANDLYHQLVQEGFKVFFARITLEDKLGQEYEPYIFAALNSAKVMVVLGTKPEYFKAVWVKNEWARYLALIRDGAKKMLIPAYKDMDPYDLPEEFSHLQAQDMTKLGFMQDIIRGIKKIIGADQPQNATKETVVVQSSDVTNNSNIQALLDRGNMALEDGEWEKADNFFEDVLNQNAKCAEAYMGKLLVKYKLINITALTKYFIDKYEVAEEESLDACPENSQYINDAVSKYAIPNFLSESYVGGLFTCGFSRKYKSKLSSVKKQKEQMLSELTNEKLFIRAKQYAIGDTKENIDDMYEQITTVLDERIAEAQHEDDMAISSIKESYEKYIIDSDAKAQEYHNRANEQRESVYNSMKNRMSNANTTGQYREVLNLATILAGYKNTQAIVEECHKKIEEIEETERNRIIENEKRESAKKKRIIIVTLIIGVMWVVGIIVTYKVIVPNIKYHKAIAMMNNEEYENAIECFSKIEWYKDSSSKKAQAEQLSMIDASVGDIVHFGDYDGNTAWRVIDRKDDKILLLSHFVIDRKAFHDFFQREVSWESCSLRQWLNSSYADISFNNKERSLIINDDITLLSIDEVNRYFNLNEDRIAIDKEGTPTRWWLRSGCGNEINAAYVMENGEVDILGDRMYVEYIGVRPALWVDLNYKLLK